MNNGTHVGQEAIRKQHKGGEITGKMSGGTPATPSQFGLPDDLANALLHPFWDLNEKTRGPFVVGVVADYATRLVRLMNAETKITAVVEKVLEQSNGTLRVITFGTDLEKHCFTTITIKMEMNGRPLYPDTPRPSNLGGDIRQAIADVLQPLGITPPHIIIPYDYSESHELLEVQRDGPTRFPSPTRPMANEVGDPYSIHTL